MLVSESIKFGASSRHKVIKQWDVDAPDGNLAGGVRTIKAMVYNDGVVDVVVTLDGSERDAGYGLAWTTRATVTCKAGASVLLAGAIRGPEKLGRIAVKTSSGVADGRIDIIDQSDNFRR